jgi:hypothetical protein
MLVAGRGYDHDKYRRLLRERGIRPVIAERGQPHGSGLGIFRRVVERTISWPHGFRRLRIPVGCEVGRPLRVRRPGRHRPSPACARRRTSPSTMRTDSLRKECADREGA